MPYQKPKRKTTPNLFFVIESLLSPGSYISHIVGEGTGFIAYTYDVTEAYVFTNEDEARGVFKFLFRTFPAVRLVLVTENPQYTFEEVAR